MVRGLIFNAVLLMSVVASQTGWAAPDVYRRLVADDVDVRKAALAEIRRRGPAAVPALLDLLGTGEPRTMYAATVTLAAIRDKRAVEPLMALLASTEFRSVRRGAARTLGYLDDRRAISILERVAKQDAERSVWREALKSLKQLDQVSVLEILLREEPSKLPTTNVRPPAIWFHTINGPGVVSMLIHALQDPSPTVRTNAATALGRVGDRDAVMPLTRLIDDGKVEVSKSAIKALGAIGEPRALPAVIQAFEDSSIGKEATRTAGRIRDASALPALYGQLDDPSMRSTALYAIGSIGNRASIKVLSAKSEAWTDQKSLKPLRNAVAALGGPDAYDWLKPRLPERKAYDYDGKLVGASKSIPIFYETHLLGRTGDPRAVDDLMNVLRYPVTLASKTRTKAKERAARAFGDIDLGEHIRPLIEAIARNDSAFVESRLSDPNRTEIKSMLQLYAVASGDDLDGRPHYEEQYQIARGRAAFALARAGAFTFLDPPAIPEQTLKNFDRATAYAQNGDEANGSVTYQSVVKSAPWWPKPYYNIALLEERYENCDCEYMLRNRQRSIDYYEKYLELSYNAADEIAVRKKIEELKLPRQTDQPHLYGEPENWLYYMPERREPKFPIDQAPIELVAPDRAP